MHGSTMSDPGEHMSAFGPNSQRMHHGCMMERNYNHDPVPCFEGFQEQFCTNVLEENLKAE